jgi:hypothetical protein
VLGSVEPPLILADVRSGPTSERNTGPFIEYDHAVGELCLRMHRSNANKDRWGLVQAPRPRASV